MLEGKLWLRSRGGEGIWYHRLNGKLTSTGFPAADRAGAEAHAAALEADLARSPARGSSSSGVPVCRVLEAWLETALATADRKGDQVLAKTSRRNARARVAMLGTLLSGLTVGDLGGETFDAYVVLRSGGSCEARQRASATLRLGRDVPTPKGAVALGTVAAELATLRTAVRDFVRQHGLQGLPELPVPQPKVHERVEVSRADLARLLWAARGWRLDPETGVWGRIDGGIGRAADVARFSRLVLVAAYTASTGACVTRLRWEGRPDGEVSYVDLLASPPVLYRLGHDAAPGKMAGMPVRLGRRITAHLRRWHAADAREGADSILHCWGGQPLTYAPQTTFKRMLREAGLSAEITMNDLRFSAGAHLARRPGVSTWSAALLLGVRASTFVERYGHLKPEYQALAVAALATRPGTGAARRKDGPSAV